MPPHSTPISPILSLQLLKSSKDSRCTPAVVSGAKSPVVHSSHLTVPIQTTLLPRRTQAGRVLFFLCFAPAARTAEGPSPHSYGLPLKHHLLAGLQWATLLDGLKTWGFPKPQHLWPLPPLLASSAPLKATAKGSRSPPQGKEQSHSDASGRSPNVPRDPPNAKCNSRLPLYLASKESSRSST